MLVNDREIEAAGAPETAGSLYICCWPTSRCRTGSIGCWPYGLAYAPDAAAFLLSIVSLSG